MPSILVVEQENRYIERISEALAPEGWKVRVVHSQAEALQAAASEAPDLVLVSAEIPGIEVVASSFSRSAGGPGVVALLAENAVETGTGGLEADELLTKPFTSQELRSVVRRVLAARREAPAAAAVGPEHKLTSRDIFGEMLAEVESEVTAAGASQSAGGSGGVRTPAKSHSETEMERKLEQTLSGVLGPRVTAAARRPAPTPPTAAKPGDDLDALISRTLSGLGAPPRPAAKPAPPRTPAPSVPPSSATPAPPPAAAIPPTAPPPPSAVAAAPAPAPAPSARAPVAPIPVAPVADSTAVRKAPAKPPDFDFSAIEELARTHRRSEGRPTPAPFAAAPARPAPAPPPPAPPAAFRPSTPERRVGARAAATQPVQIVPEGREPGERFGQYTLQEKIATGGMAEVWKARMRGVEGFQKTVAIKKILPHLTDNSEFVGMFIDEAKLAAQLSHPNIIHIYDLGKIGRDYYIAMEYVEGKDLRSILNAGRKRDMPMPLGLALLIAGRLASALDYAHRKRDFEDRELGLVHRDVSPQNVLITFEGDIKLCDFGIAKAVSKASQTQMGALKGKLQYMSPEQAWGKPVDARSDIFSLGAILFEMLTGERLFPGDSEMSVLEAVRDGRTRSARAVAPAVPPEVDAVVQKALAHEPGDRFPSAGEMQARIESILYALKPAPSLTDLAAYMHRLLDMPAPEVLTPPAPTPPEPARPSRVTPPPAAIPPPPAMPAAAPSPSNGPAAVEAVAAVGEVRVDERPSRMLLYAAVLALAVLGGLSYFLFARKSGAPARAPATVAAAPAAAAASLPALGQTVPGATAAGAPGSKTTATAPPAAGAKVDVSGVVSQELAKREGELRKKFEDEQKRLEKELALTKNGKPSAIPPATAPAPPPSAAPAPQPTEPPAAEKRPEPPATKPEEPAAAVVPPAASRPAPAPETTEPAPQAPRVKPGDLVEPGPGVAPPELVSVTKPEYPPLARRLKVAGTVIVSVLVDEKGHVEDAKLLQGVVQKVGLNEAAVSAARTARYKPASKDGVKVKMWTRLRIPFTQ